MLCLCCVNISYIKSYTDAENTSSKKVKEDEVNEGVNIHCPRSSCGFCEQRCSGGNVESEV